MAFKALKSYQMAITTTSGSTRVVFDDLIQFIPENSVRQIRISTAAGDAIAVCNIGDATVVADENLTANALPDGNFHLHPGAIEVFDIEESQNNIAGITATGTATFYITLGYGERS